MSKAGKAHLEDKEKPKILEILGFCSFEESTQCFYLAYAFGYPFWVEPSNSKNEPEGANIASTRKRNKAKDANFDFI